MKKIQKIHTDGIRTTIFAGNDQFILTGGFDFRIKLWAFDINKLNIEFVEETSKHKNSIRCLSVIKNNK